MSGSGWHWMAVAAYSLLVIGIGFLIRRTARRVPDEGVWASLEFWMAKRQLPGWRLAISLTSGWLMLGWIGFGMSQIYMFGATALWILPIPWLILCFIIILMVPYVRRIGAVSLPEAVERRFGPGARWLLGIFSFFVFIAWTQAELFMAGTLMSPFLGVPAWLCMAVLVLPIMLYTFLGGFRAIVATDLAQFGLMAIFMAILGGFALAEAWSASGGRIAQTLAESSPPWSGPNETFNLFFLGPVFPLILLIGYLPGWTIEQDLTLRIQAAKSTREAVKGAVIGLAFIAIFVLALPCLAAFCALIVFPPAENAAAQAVGENGLEIIAAFIQRMPLALAVFMLLGIVACQMSTVDTFANVSAMALSYDIVEPIMARRGGLRRRLALSRNLSVLVLLIGYGCALISESLNDVYYISSGVLSACIAVPAIAIFWKRANLPAAMAASIVGFLGVIGGYWLEFKFLQMENPEAPRYYVDILPVFLQGSYQYNYVALGVVLSLSALIAVSFATAPSDARRLASVRPAPIDATEDFVRSLS